MNMTSRELVKRSLEFDAPERLPRQIWLLPWAVNHHPEQAESICQQYPDDIITSPGFAEPLKTQGDPYKAGIHVDEWGCVFENRQDGIIGEVKDPLVKKWETVAQLREPVEALTVDKNKVNEFCRGSDKFVMANCCPRPFERLQFLRGTENAMMDLGVMQPELFELLDKIHRFFIKEVELWSSTDVDGIMFMDDWGAQRSLLISPDLWRQIFKPLYKEYIDIAHAGGKKIFMHSDGYIIDIIEDLVELGLDALNSQVFCMGLEELCRRFKGRITFWGEIARQHLLPDGDREQIVEAVELFNECFYDNGGVIAQLEFGPGSNPENVRTALETWDRFRAAV